MIDQSAKLLKALAHPTRLGILEILKDHDELCVCHIYEGLNLEQSNISQHLRIMRTEGILDTRRDGLKIMYRVKYPEVYELLSCIETILRNIAEEMSQQIG